MKKKLALFLVCAFLFINLSVVGFGATIAPVPTPTPPPIFINYDLVGFSGASLYEMASTIRSNLGGIISIALYIFLIVLCVHVVIDVIDFLGR